MERHQQEWKKCLNPESNRDPPAYAADSSADDTPTTFQYISSSFNQFLFSLAALVWGSDCGGPVGEAEKPEVASV